MARLGTTGLLPDEPRLPTTRLVSEAGFAPWDTRRWTVTAGAVVLGAVATVAVVASQDSTASGSFVVRGP